MHQLLTFCPIALFLFSLSFICTHIHISPKLFESKLQTSYHTCIPKSFFIWYQVRVLPDLTMV